MKKKAVTLLLATSMLTTLFAGCGGNTDKSAGKGNSDAGSVADHTVDENGKVNGLMYETGLPLVDEGTYGFTIFCDDSSETGKFYMIDELKKQTNVDVTLDIKPNETATEVMNLALNSGDYADVIGGWILNDSKILTYGVNQGVFIPLEDLFEKYCPNISAILELPGVKEKMTTPDGHIYTIPYVCSDTMVGYAPYINTEWLEAVGMEMPTTTDEFVEVLRAFKEKDPNGNGEKDEIPFSADPNNKHIEAMAGWFGMPMDKVGMTMNGEEPMYAGVSTKYREFLSWFNSLYEEGLIDLELYTQDSATWEGKGNQDLYGCSIAYESGEFSGDEKLPTVGRFDVLPVLNTDNGGMWLRDTNGFSVYRTQAVITDNAKNPEIIARWFDNAFELENGIGCNRGPVGIAVTKQDDGYHGVDPKTLSQEQQEELSWGNLWPQSLPKYLPADFEFVEDNPLYKEHDALEEKYEPYLTKNVIPSFWVDLDKVDLYADINTAITDYFTQQQAMFITGELDIDDDAAWQAYVDGIKNLGLEDWLDCRKVTKIAE